MAKRLGLGNLPCATTDQQLATFFSEAGQVNEVSIVYDRETGRSKGFGFVEMAEDSSAKKAIEQFEGTVYGCRTIKVAEARLRPTSSWR